jgi:uncharacterized membrane protein YozB (DUF420 family)
MGFLGTAAEIIFDVNLVIQWIIFVFLILGYIKKSDLRTHGVLMVLTTIVGLVTTLVIMAPALIMNWGLYNITILGHAAIGIIAILLGLLFSYRYLMATRSGGALDCGNRSRMRIALVLWIVPVFFGTFTYLMLYVLV